MRWMRCQVRDREICERCCVRVEEWRFRKKTGMRAKGSACGEALWRLVRRREGAHTLAGTCSRREPPSRRRRENCGSRRRRRHLRGSLSVRQRGRAAGPQRQIFTPTRSRGHLADDKQGVKAEHAAGVEGSRVERAVEQSPQPPPPPPKPAFVLSGPKEPGRGALGVSPPVQLVHTGRGPQKAAP